LARRHPVDIRPFSLDDALVSATNMGLVTFTALGLLARTPGIHPAAFDQATKAHTMPNRHTARTNRHGVHESTR